MAQSAPLSKITLKKALHALKKGTLSVEELWQKCSQRLKRTQHLNMFVSETSEDFVRSQLMKSSDMYAKGQPRRLEGIPIAFKDNFCTKGIPTTCSSRMLQNYVPPYDATMVSKCAEQGAVMAGKVNMDEFAMGSANIRSCHGPVINPWNLDKTVSQSKPNNDSHSKETLFHATSLEQSDWHVSGGSSGGTASAVAAGTCLAAFGSDTGGSVRLPCSYSGVLGLKPTYGLLSRHGLIPLVNSLDVPGIVTKTAEDAAIVLDAVCGHDVKDSTTVSEKHGPFIIQEDLDLSKLSVGIPKELHSPNLSPEILSLWQETADALADAGARVTEVSLPHCDATALNCYYILCCCELASNFSRYDGIEYGLREGSEHSTEELYAESRHKGFNDVVRGRILAGNYFLLKRNYERFFEKAQRVRRLIYNDFRDTFANGIDILLNPVAIGDAPEVKWFFEKDTQIRLQEQDLYTVPVNLAGIPGVTIPLKLSEKGLPLSLQLVGPMFSEARLLSVAHWLEHQVNFPFLDLDYLDQ